MRVVVRGRRAKAVRLVESTGEHCPPAPLFRSDNFGGWIGGSNRARIGHDFVVDLLVVRRVGMRIAMRLMPQRRLVVENVIFDPAGGGGRAIGGHEMLQPALLNTRAVGNTRIERVVAGDVLARRGAYA